jgi:NTE family protein
MPPPWPVRSDAPGPESAALPCSTSRLAPPTLCGREMSGPQRKPEGELAITLGGGGARGAYQAGVLRELARRFPELELPILTGVSAGGINAALLAAHRGSFEERAEELVKLWSGLSVDQVFRVDSLSLLRQVLGWIGQLLFLGGRRGVPQVRGLVDTAPLFKFLEEAVGGPDGRLRGVAENLAEGRLKALALTATCYGSGQSVTWCHGRVLRLWERPQRIAVPTEMRIEHVMASAGLPLFFPAVEVDGRWYGDGGIRLHSPLAPAIHLGARRILAISTRYLRSGQEAGLCDASDYPPPAQVLGVLMNAIFLDLFDQDAVILERVNRLLARLPAEDERELRPVELLMLRPSVDLGQLANDYEPRLPGLFRFLTRRLGTRRSRNEDAVSLILFQGDYLRRLIEIGERDAAARADEIEAFLRT